MFLTSIAMILLTFFCLSQQKFIVSLLVQREAEINNKNVKKCFILKVRWCTAFCNQSAFFPFLHIKLIDVIHTRLQVPRAFTGYDFLEQACNIHLFILANFFLFPTKRVFLAEFICRTTTKP